MFFDKSGFILFKTEMEFNAAVKAGQITLSRATKTDQKSGFDRFWHLLNAKLRSLFR